MPTTTPAPAVPAPLERPRLPLRDELLLALLPTITVLLVLALVEAYSHQRLLFASLASSAFLIYLDPRHRTNSARTLLLAQLSAAGVGYLVHTLLGDGYWAGAVAMLVIIGLMIALQAVHPPAVSTALSFAFKGERESNLWLFVGAVVLIVLLVALQQASVWALRRLSPPVIHTSIPTAS